MYYVVKKGVRLENYHSAFYRQDAARDYAENLKTIFGHNYDVIHMSTVWTTQTLHEAMMKGK